MGWLDEKNGDQSPKSSYSIRFIYSIVQRRQSLISAPLEVRIMTAGYYGWSLAYF